MPSLRRRLTRELADTPSAFVVLAGLWITVAPLVLDDNQARSTWNKLIAGLLLTTSATARVLRPVGTATLSMVNVCLGGWLIAAPAILGYQGAVALAWTDITVGGIVTMLAGVSWLTGGHSPG